MSIYLYSLNDLQVGFLDGCAERTPGVGYAIDLKSGGDTYSATYCWVTNG